MSVSRLTAVLSLTVCGACSPLVADVGVELNDAGLDANVIAPPTQDAGTVVESGVVQDSASSDASQPVEAGDDDAPVQVDPEPCLYFPDVIGPFQETGVTSVDGGVITGSLDQASSCPSPQANAVSYRRNDGRPLVEANHAYVWNWPSGGGGSLTAYAANDACEKPPFPLDFWIFVKDLPRSCRMVTFGSPFHVLRLTNVQAPTPFPQGFSLCEPPCP